MKSTIEKLRFGLNCVFLTQYMCRTKNEKIDYSNKDNFFFF